MTQYVCPKCRGEMHSYERNGVTVEQCSDCRGLFLDRGELEHLVAAEQAWAAAPAQEPPNYRQPAPPPPPQPYQQPGYQQPSYGDPSYGYHPKYKYKKKKSFFEDLFD